MRAAVVRGERLEIRDDVVLADPGPGEIRVRIAACGVCGSDLSMLNGSSSGAMPGPFALGHEAAGRVVATGEGVTTVETGDHVVLSFVAPCGRCPECWAGQSNLCRDNRLMAKDGGTPLRLADGPVGRMGPAAFAEETVVPESAAVRIDKDVPLDLASLVGCGVMTGVGAAIGTAKVEPGSRVAVVGCGGVGINVIQGARIAGATTIVAIDPVADRRKTVLDFGATHAGAPDELESLTRTLTGGAGFDYVFEASGHPDALRPAILASRRGGSVVLVGLSNAELPVSVREIALAQRSILGSFYGSARMQLDIPKVIDLWRTGRLDLAGLVTERLPLERLAEGFDALRAGQGIRTVITMGDDAG